MWIPVGNEEAVSGFSEAAHASVGTTFYPNLNPQIFIAHNGLQYSESTGIRKSFLTIVACPAYVLYLPGGHKAFVFPVGNKGNSFSSILHHEQSLLQFCYMTGYCFIALFRSGIIHQKIISPENVLGKICKSRCNLLFFCLKFCIQLLQESIECHTAYLLTHSSRRRDIGQCTNRRNRVTGGNHMCLCM